MTSVPWLTLLALTLVAISETLILHWGSIVLLGSGFGSWTTLSCVVGLASMNFVAMTVLRDLSWDVPTVWATVRTYMLGSVAAILTGPLILFSLLVAAIAGSSNVAIAGGGIAVALGFGSILWGFLIGQRWVRIDHTELPLHGLSDSLKALRIAQISDLHIGRQLRAPQLRDYIERINKLNADIIVITGDIFDFNPKFIEEGCRELAKLRAKHGVFAVLGNHDIYTGAEAVCEGLQRWTSIEVLRDRWIHVEVDGSLLCMAGLDDPGRDWTDRDAESPVLERFALEIPREMPTVLLIHRPSFFAHAARLGFPIVLSGHTHGGQVALPPPAHHHNASRLIARWTRGLFEIDQSVLYVNRGLGVAGLPVRLNCPREISLHRFIPRRT